MELEIIDHGPPPASVGMGDIRELLKHPDINPETLRQFIEIFREEQNWQSNLLFDRAFAAMQAEFSPVKKGRPVRDKSGKIAYYYAALEDLQNQFGPTIAKHGFSYSFSDSALPDTNGWRRVTIRIAGHGAARESSADMPPVQGTRLMSAQQCLGAQNTYARRYAFISGFGLVVEGEDNDAVRSADTPADTDMAAMENECRSARTIEELQATYQRIKAETGNNPSIYRPLARVCAERKKDLTTPGEVVY